METNSAFEVLGKKYGNKRLTRAKAIRVYCKEQCCCGDMRSWQECTNKACVLWRFRKGKEILGNSTSFTKDTAKRGVLGQQNASDKECEEDQE